MSIESVQEFWEAEACGERYGAEQDRIRYELEPEILSFADFASAPERVLEIGVGMGADHLRWVQHADYVAGIDLTQRAVEIAAQRLRERGLPSRLQIGDAENLPYADASFDLVYSWGVLHHTPNTQRALDEAHRVLKRDGTLKLMLYHRHSWVALAAWGAKGLARGRLLTLKQAIALTESPGTKAFTSKEVREMLREFRQVEVRPHLTSWDRKFVPGLSRLGNNRFGWFLLIKATK